jgi:uncharacterized protein (DUF4213/DUF364 family)
MPEVRMTLGIGFANACQEEIIDVDDQEWADCENDKQRDDLLDSYWKDWAWNYIDGGFEVL